MDHDARLIRWSARIVAVLVAATVGAVLAFPSDSAAAHTALALTVNDDGRGSVSVDVAWDDGHPVTETIAATLTATSATGRIGPVGLVRLPGQATVVYEGTLPAGRWDVVVDAGLPGIGHCEATVTVSTSAGKPGSTRCGSPPAAAPVAAGSAADRGLGARTLLVWIVAVAGALAVVAVLVLLVRRRTAPAPVSRGRRR